MFFTEDNNKGSLSFNTVNILLTDHIFFFKFRLYSVESHTDFRYIYLKNKNKSSQFVMIQNASKSLHGVLNRHLSYIAVLFPLSTHKTYNILLYTHL